MNNFYSYFTHSHSQYEHIDLSSQDILEEFGEEIISLIKMEVYLSQDWVE